MVEREEELWGPSWVQGSASYSSSQPYLVNPTRTKAYTHHRELARGHKAGMEGKRMEGTRKKREVNKKGERKERKERKYFLIIM